MTCFEAKSGTGASRADQGVRPTSFGCFTPELWYDAGMARLFKWDASHEIYLPEIDAEHRALFEIGDEIQQALQSGAGPEQLRPMVAALMTCAEDHFAHEERLMVAARYSAYEWHKAQHDGVRRRMRSFLQSLEQGDPQAPQLLLEYLA